MSEEQIYRNTHINKTNALAMIEGVRQGLKLPKDKEIFEKHKKENPTEDLHDSSSYLWQLRAQRHLEKVK